jgi:uncharacterized membrane protein
LCNKQGNAVHPFDIKSALLAKHAQHVVLIHFPIALFMMGAGFDFLAQWTGKKTLAAAAYYNLLAAAVSTLPVLATGLLAWQFALEGQRLKGALLTHLVLAFVTSAVMWLVGWLHHRAWRKPERSLPGYRLPLEFVGVILVGLTGHLGGFLSGVNGPG